MTEVKTNMNHFMMALDEVRPAFGVDSDQLVNCTRGGMHMYSKPMTEVFTTCTDLVKSIKNSSSTSLLTILLEGKPGAGKTALAAKLAMNSDFPYVKMISPEMFVGKPDF